MRPHPSNWQPPPAPSGATASERYLAKVARRAFLSLWSHANVYTDEGRARGKGDGKELCDLLLVFGDHVVLFSDKHCAFTAHVDEKVAWTRWYRRAVKKSVDQLMGAEAFLKRHPGRLFSDKSCAHPLPLALPPPDKATYHLVAATRGSHAAAVDHWRGQSTGSFLLNNAIEGDAHGAYTFQIGWPVGRKRFVHVLDELALDVLLDELDTVPDFLQYLAQKEALFRTVDTHVIAAGEEELVLQFLMTNRNGRHAFPEIPAGHNVCFAEGDWAVYENSPQRIAKKMADRDSLRWDALIEFHSGYLRSGAALNPVKGIPDEFFSPHYGDHERVIRILADETRLSRRLLERSLRYALCVNEPGKFFARVAPSSHRPGRYYVFLTVPKTPGDSDASYRESRFVYLYAYCQGVKTKFPDAQEVLGIASDPLAQGGMLQDFLHVEMGTAPLTPQHTEDIQKMLNDVDVFQEHRMTLGSTGKELEYPLQFAVPNFSFNDGRAPNHSQRRAKAAAARRKKRT